MKFSLQLFSSGASNSITVFNLDRQIVSPIRPLNGQPDVARKLKNETRSLSLRLSRHLQRLNETRRQMLEKSLEISNMLRSISGRIDIINSSIYHSSSDLCHAVSEAVQIYIQSANCLNNCRDNCQ